jgi:endo-1,4-beta-mannosidase
MRSRSDLLSRAAGGLGTLCLAVLGACGGGGTDTPTPTPTATPTPTPEPTPVPMDFLRVSGTSFSDGRRFLGINLDPWRFMTHLGEVYSCEELRDWVTTGRESTAARVVRVQMNGRAFEPSIGSYREEAFQQLDCVVATAAALDMRTIVALRDYVWSPWPAEADDPYWYLGGGSTTNPNKDAIVTDGTARQAFQDFITHVVNRTNSVNGLRYRDDPSILAWEMINEPNLSAPGFAEWLRATTAHLRTEAPNHLVTVGIAALEQDWWDQAPQTWSTFSPVDFLDLHYYADPALYGPPADAANVARLRRRLESALGLGKPVVMGEFGCVSTQPEEVVLSLYRTLITTTFEAGGAGALPYAWGPPGPHGWGGPGSFDVFTDDTAVCALLRSLAPQ